MRVFCAAAIVALVAGPAYGQEPLPKAGEATGKSDKEIRDEKEAQKAYQKSLGNIPEQKATDPWGTMRGDSAPKPARDKAAKDPATKTPAKRAKADGTSK